MSIADWAIELENDPDTELLFDMESGFKITDEGSIFKNVECENYLSATQTYPHQVEAQIYKELDEGNYVITHRKPTIVSSIGAIPKDKNNLQGGIRLIHDGSLPEGANLNSYASKHKFSYQTLDDAASKVPPGGYIAKVDLRSAYRSISIHNSCYAATGLKWRFAGNKTETYMYDTRLPFGASKSCYIFQRISNAIVRMMERRGYCIVGYLDDFLIISNSKQACQEAYDTLLALLQRLGFEIQWSKVVPPSQKLVFLGVEIDTQCRTLALPKTKMDELKDLLGTWICKQKATKLELQKLIGKLNWAARVIRGGRTFLRRLIDLMCKLRRKHHRTKLNQNARADISWWSHCMSFFNGTAKFITDIPVPSDQLSCDACLLGGAAYYNGDWFYTSWHVDHPDIVGSHINCLECFTLLLAARRWKSHWANKHLVVYSDNTTTVSAINNGSSRSKDIMPYLRELFWLSVESNFHITARHLPGRLNILSDRLSRLHDPTNWQPLSSLPTSAPSINYGNSLVLNLYGHVSYPCYLYLQERFEHNGWPFKAR